MKKILLSIVLFGTTFFGVAQVGIGTTNPAASAELDISSTTKGVLLPRMTKVQIQAIANPTTGLLVYCLDCTPKMLFMFNGVEFIDIISGASINAAALAAIVVDATDTSVSSSPSLADLTALGVTGLTSPQTHYKLAIASSSPAPTTLAALQVIIDAVNTAFAAELADVATIVANSNTRADGTPSIAELAAMGATNLVVAQAYYEVAIAGASPAPTTLAALQTIIDAVNTASKDNTTVVVDVAGQNNTIWMDRNLGASQKATSSTDPASYGDLYQWGRRADGHQIIDSNITVGPIASGTEGDNFITSTSDWLSTSDDTLWQVAGTNDPCPTGYRVPTETELNNELTTFKADFAAGAIASLLKWPLAGYRKRADGVVENRGVAARYWSSTTTGGDAQRLLFNSGDAVMGVDNRAFGFSVRCIKNQG